MPERNLDSVNSLSIRIIEKPMFLCYECVYRNLYNVKCKKDEHFAF